MKTTEELQAEIIRMRRMIHISLEELHEASINVRIMQELKDKKTQESLIKLNRRLRYECEHINTAISRLREAMR